MIFYRIARTLLLPFIYGWFLLSRRGVENLPKTGGYLVCANHTSMADILVLAAAHPRPLVFMAKSELLKNPVMKFLMWALGAITVNRGTGDMAAIRKSVEVLKGGGIMMIFPEGTRVREGEKAVPKGGAVMIANLAGAPIVPAGISGGKRRKPSLFSRSRVVFGTPVSSEALKSVKRDAAAELIMDQIRALSGMSGIEKDASAEERG